MGPSRGSFGLGTSINGRAEGRASPTCTTDYISIPNGAQFMTLDPAQQAGEIHTRYCGRYLNPVFTPAMDNTATDRRHDRPICSSATPFKLTFVTDADEELGAEAATNPNVNEASSGIAANAAGSQYPLGTMGFNLQFVQQTCT